MFLKISKYSQENYCAGVSTYQFNSQSMGQPDKRRNSRWRWSVKKGVLKNLANFTGKYLCWNLFLINLQQIRSATLLKLESNTDVFLRNLRNFWEYLFWRTSANRCFHKRQAARNSCFVDLGKRILFSKPIARQWLLPKNYNYLNSTQLLN